MVAYFLDLVGHLPARARDRYSPKLVQVQPL